MTFGRRASAGLNSGRHATASLTYHCTVTKNLRSCITSRVSTRPGVQHFWRFFDQAEGMVNLRSLRAGNRWWRVIGRPVTGRVDSAKVVHF